MDVTNLVYVNNFGVSKIVGNEEDKLIIEPLFDTRGIIKLAKTSENIRKLLSKDEIDKIIYNVKESDEQWISKFISRKNKYSQIKANPHPFERFSMIKVIFKQYKYRKENNLKGGLSSKDLDFYHKSLDLIFNEFSEVLNIKRSEVAEYIFKIWKDDSIFEYLEV